MRLVIFLQGQGYGAVWPSQSRDSVDGDGVQALRVYVVVVRVRGDCKRDHSGLFLEEQQNPPAYLREAFVGASLGICVRQPETSGIAKVVMAMTSAKRDELKRQFEFHVQFAGGLAFICDLFWFFPHSSLDATRHTTNNDRRPGLLVR
jgi:hypothetical protein